MFGFYCDDGSSSRTCPTQVTMLRCWHVHPLGLWEQSDNIPADGKRKRWGEIQPCTVKIPNDLRRKWTERWHHTHARCGLHKSLVYRALTHSTQFCPMRSCTYCSAIEFNTETRTETRTIGAPFKQWLVIGLYHSVPRGRTLDCLVCFECVYTRTSERGNTGTCASRSI